MKTEMLKLAVVFLFGVVWGGRLENTYLPPSGAKTAGGNGNFLETSFSNGNGATVVSDGDFDNGGFDNGTPTPGTSRFGSNVKQFGSNGNGSFRKNGQSNRIYAGPARFGINGGKPAAPISNGAIGIGSQLFPEYSAPVSSDGSVGDGTSVSLIKNANGVSSDYGVPAQNGNRVTNTGSYSGSLSAPNILRYNSENDGTGIYRFEYETENHISQQERGDLKNVGANSESSVVQGTYSYVGPDGHTYTVNYIADENGFQPTGEHIHLAVQAAAADAARTAGTEGKVGDYSSGGQYQSTANGGYQY